MQPMAALRKRFETEVWPRPFEPLPRIGSDGLMLGHGTVLARWARNQAGHAFAEADGERVVALRSAVHGRPVSPQVMKHVARAAMRWSAGEKALAHIELAFARLPRLDTSEDGYRLFLAGCLLDEGTTPRRLAEALGFDPDVLKYDPKQPRVPAGNGRESGRWGGGEINLPGALKPSKDRSAQLHPGIVLVADQTTPHGFGYGRKIEGQMKSRNFSPEQVDEAVRLGKRIDALNKATGGPATRYVNPNTGQSVVIDNTTNEVIQVGRPDFEFGPKGGDVPGATMRPAPVMPLPPPTIVEEPIIIPDIILPP